MFKRYIHQQIRPFTTEYSDPQAGESPLFVVIPCFNEPDIVTTLDALHRCHRPQSPVTVIIVVNAADNSPETVVQQNQITLREIQEWRKMTDCWFNLEVLHAAELPNKWAGVGWARKIGFDQAISHLAEREASDGILVAFDADSTAWPNFLTEIEKAFRLHPKHHFFTIHFEHPVTGHDSPPLGDPDREEGASLIEGIIRYELHLRYLRKAMEWCGYSHSIHTVGSSMAVRASAYVKQGGMNRRKAGEDFYFLHKLVLLGSYGNINTTCVIPAARVSDRVPFGTGAALRKWDNGEEDLFTTYAFASFQTLKPFFEEPERYYTMDRDTFLQLSETFHPALKEYILTSGAPDIIAELQANCSTVQIFTTRFFHRINAFWIIKYLNIVAEGPFPKGELTGEVNQLLINLGLETKTSSSPLQLMIILREMDRLLGNNS